MFKRNTAPTSLLSVFALAVLCLFAADVAAQTQVPANQTRPASIAGLNQVTLDLAPQKGAQGTAGSVKPIKGVDVIVQKNPGNTAVRTATTDGDGKVKFVGLAPGKYSLVLRKGSKTTEAKVGGAAADAADDGDYLLTIEGAVGGPIKSPVSKGMKFPKLPSQMAKATGAPVYEDKLLFEIGPPTSPPTPVSITIIKSKSNITNN